MPVDRQMEHMAKSFMRRFAHQLAVEPPPLSIYSVCLGCVLLCARSCFVPEPWIAGVVDTRERAVQYTAAPIHSDANGL